MTSRTNQWEPFWTSSHLQRNLCSFTIFCGNLLQQNQEINTEILSKKMIKNMSLSTFYLLFWSGGHTWWWSGFTLYCTQASLLIGWGKSHGVLQIKPQSAPFKANILPTVLSVWSRLETFLVWKGVHWYISKHLSPWETFPDFFVQSKGSFLACPHSSLCQFLTLLSLLNGHSFVGLSYYKNICRSRVLPAPALRECVELDPTL